ncbi:type III-A CRISPR-associated RAMP protein Csm5 [uncultured Ruminococcus sp.]|uniref:type III-A CRISPR-associated RAMP protein Csm5 n=1 Tax=uncultured Ruminococcus sp. TaxID=165186 RepID=UPI0025E261D1|nr:type III-A CRISPR-associated RAMP protein Csm5 [uncultured Ruminococcus sp.]
MRYYDITIETIGPVHIGSGKEISKKECLYVPQEKKIYIMDEKKMFSRILALGKQESFTRYLMDSRQNNLMNFVRDNNISPNEYKKWAAYVLDDIGAVNVGKSRSKGGGADNVHAFMKDAYGCPYIPGSSLKGALRTVIQSCLVNYRMDSFRSERNDIETEQFRRRPSYLSKANQEIAQKLFYTLERPDAKPHNAVNDCFSGIRVSDSEPLSVSDLVLCRKTDLLPDYEKENSISVKRECLKPGTKVKFSLEIDESLFDMDSKKLISYIDDNYIMYHNAYLLMFPEEAQHAPQKGEHLLYLGGGSGYATKTTVYPMYSEDDINRAVKTVQKIMVDTTSTKRDGDLHKHRFDLERYEVSPHTLKVAKIGGRIYEMGLCKVDISEKK